MKVGRILMGTDERVVHFTKNMTEVRFFVHPVA